MVNTKILLLY